MHDTVADTGAAAASGDQGVEPKWDTQTAPAPSWAEWRARQEAYSYWWWRWTRFHGVQPGPGP